MTGGNVSAPGRSRYAPVSRVGTTARSIPTAARRRGAGRDGDGARHDLLVAETHVHGAAAELERNDRRPLAHVDTALHRRGEQRGVRAVRVQEPAVALEDGGLTR